jgi:hypothetical protein
MILRVLKTLRMRRTKSEKVKAASAADRKKTMEISDASTR